MIPPLAAMRGLLSPAKEVRMFNVSLVMLVAGNPLKAWHGTTGEDDTVHVPDDEWEDQVWPFEDLDEAKAYIRDLHPDSTTHVELSADGEVIYRQDAGDDLDLAEPGYVQDSMQEAEPDDDVVPEGPPVGPRQGAVQ